jgi:insulysin
MKLAVVGKDDVDVMEGWIRDRFSAVPVRTEGAPAVGSKGVRVVFEDSPVDVEKMGVS